MVQHHGVTRQRGTGSEVHGAMVNGCGALMRASDTGRYLFLLRDGCRFGNTWGLPGGKFENSETTIEALRRELREELGQDIEYDKIVPIETFTSDDRRFIYHTFLMVVPHEFVPTLNSEHRGYCWVSINDHPRPLHPGVWRTFKFDSVRQKIETMEKLLPINGVASRGTI
jgi:8-oxo-dGTP diphosphatase